ncbi:MAG: hypothetical protein RBU23_10840 [Candidatus Auribacterota bacterium]|jgi:hypothetical protein|nr:hypothetical protein [Candidatus Auribacterota bacterium]
MDLKGNDLIHRVGAPPRANDHHDRHENPDRVQFNKDRGHQHHQDQRRKRKQKNFSQEDPHVDIQA